MLILCKGGQNDFKSRMPSAQSLSWEREVGGGGKGVGRGGPQRLQGLRAMGAGAAERKVKWVW